MNPTRALPGQGSWTNATRWTASRTRFRSTLRAAVVWISVAVFVAGARGHGDRNEHLARLDAKLEADPNAVALLLERAAAHRRLGHFDASLADLDRVLRVAPDHPQAHYLRGLTHLESGSLAEAEVALRRYLESAPQSPSGHTALAETLTRQGRHLAAAAEYTLAIAAQPTPVPDHYLARAKAYRAAGQPHLKLAVEGLDEGMSAIGPLITLQRLAIDIELDRGHHAAAITRIDGVLAKATRKESWLVHKGRVLASIGRDAEALDAFRLAEAAIDSLPHRLRASQAMAALRETISNNLNKDTAP